MLVNNGMATLVDIACFFLPAFSPLKESFMD